MNSAEFLEKLLKLVVSNTEEVKVSEKESILEVSANNADLGVIIGKGGKNIRALRNVINLKTAKEGKPRIEIKIREEEKNNGQ